jgi:hypothetical protein
MIILCKKTLQPAAIWCLEIYDGIDWVLWASVNLFSRRLVFFWGGECTKCVRGA